MPKLSDTQSILLSAAAQRDTLSLYPLPATLRPGGGVAKALAALVRGGYAQESETTQPSAVHREEGDVRYGLYATAAGLAAIGIEGQVPGAGDETAAAAITTTLADVTESVPASLLSQSRTTKAATVLALLQRERGATVSELIAATDWLPHTTRAALSGLRKNGHLVERSKRGDATCYRITAVARTERAAADSAAASAAPAIAPSVAPAA